MYVKIPATADNQSYIRARIKHWASQEHKQCSVTIQWDRSRECLRISFEPKHALLEWILQGQADDLTVSIEHDRREWETWAEQWPK